MTESLEDYSISVRGLPPISHVARGSSSCNSTSDHEETMSDEKQFRGLTDSHITPCNSLIWIHYNRQKKLTWSCETALQYLVKIVLVDIFEEGGLISILDCELELSLFDAKRKQDIMLVCKFGVPIGFVKVKKPGKGIQSDNKVFGQVLDHLSYIKHYTGRRHPFAILSSYEEWRVFWLPETDEVAESTKLGQHHDCPVASRDQFPSGPITTLPTDPPEWSDGASHSFPHLKPQLASTTNTCITEPKTRLVSMSKIIQWNDRSLPSLILSCLRKMINSPMDPIASMESLHNRSYIYVTADEWKWVKPTSVTQLVIEGSSVPSHFQNAFLLYDLGGGGDGRVWLGSTMKGKVCVLKFSNEKSSLELEEKVWNSVRPECKVKVKQLNGRWVLVMPWVKPCTEQEFHNEDVRKAIKVAIERLADAGYKHDDLSLRHVGLCRINSKVEAVLFDFARVSTFRQSKSDEQRIDAISNMMKELKL